MKRCFPLILCFCLFLGSTGLSNSLKNESSSKVYTHIRNIFGLPYKIDGETLFQSRTAIFSSTKEIKNLRNGRLIYFDNSEHSFLPSSFGDDSIVAIEDKDGNQFLYNQFQIEKDIKRQSFQFFRETAPLGILSSRLKSFSLRINKNNSFVNPAEILKDSLQDTRVKTIVLPGVLLESGIYIRYVSSSKATRIPLRKDYTIYAYAYEKTQGDGTRTLPRGFRITIDNTSKSTVVLQKQLDFLSIKGNKMNGSHFPSEFYRKYGYLSIIKLGVWDNINRMDNYRLTITAVGTNREETSLQIPIEFY